MRQVDDPQSHLALDLRILPLRALCTNGVPSTETV